jgi:hypothetical protein
MTQYSAKMSEKFQKDGALDHARRPEAGCTPPRHLSEFSETWPSVNTLLGIEILWPPNVTLTWGTLMQYTTARH